MLIKLHPLDEPKEVTLPEFKLLTKQGKIVPTSLVQDPDLTQGEWRTADNLSAFHRYSPTVYPPGPHLAREQSKFKPTEELVQRARVDFDAYCHGTLIEACYRVPPLESLGPRATRLIMMPSFHAERVLTVIFQGEGLRIEAAMSHASSVWSSVSQVAFSSDGRPVEPTPFDPDLVVQRYVVQSDRGLLPAWDDLIRTARRAGDASTTTLDGVSFRHRVLVDGHAVEARWSNPDPSEHPVQWSLIRAYRSLLNRAGMSEFDLPSGY